MASTGLQALIWEAEYDQPASALCPLPSASACSPSSWLHLAVLSSQQLFTSPPGVFGEPKRSEVSWYSCADWTLNWAANFTNQCTPVPLTTTTMTRA